MESKNECVKIDSTYIKGALKKAGIKHVTASRFLGMPDNGMSAALNRGSLRKETLDRLCSILDIPVEKCIAIEKPKEETPTPEKDATSANDNAIQALIFAIGQYHKDIVSYLQDLGKIQTELLRSVKDMHKDLLEAQSVSNGKKDELITLLTDAKDCGKNFHVSCNSHLNKIFNQMKYSPKTAP